MATWNALLFCCVLLFSGCIAALDLHQSRHDWFPDGAIYLRMTLQDRGMNANDARERTRQFVLGEFARGGRGNEYRRLYAEKPPDFYQRQFPLFVVRPIYPLLSALLYPAFGPFALKIVSALAFVLSAGTLFALLRLVSSPLLSALGTAAFSAEQIVLHTATMAGTDQLALLFWICALGAVIAYQRRPMTLALGAIGLASIALTLTRPAFFLPLGAAAGAYYAMRRAYPARVAFAPVVATLPAALAYVILGLAVHGPSLFAQLSWQYWFSRASGDSSALHYGILAWYGVTLAHGIGHAVLDGCRQLGGLFLVILAALGAQRHFRNGGTVRIAVCAVAASCFALLVNPIDVDRPVLLPMSPLVVILALAYLKGLLFTHPPERRARVSRRSDEDRGIQLEPLPVDDYSGVPAR